MSQVKIQARISVLLCIEKILTGKVEKTCITLQITLLAIG